MFKKIIFSGLLLLTAMIWGFTFVTQSVAMDYIEPFSFIFARCIIGGSALIPLVFVTEKSSNAANRISINKKNILSGMICGVCLFGGMAFQQIGIQFTSTGKAGFITACYIILVPVASFFVFRKKIGVSVWISVLMGIAGLYMLCMSGRLALSPGDTYIMICAIMYTLHILTVDYFVKDNNPIFLSCIQFFTCGILSMFVMFITENPTCDKFVNAWMPILFAGIMSTGVGYTLQIVCQKELDATIASLIMSMEAVFSVIGGYIFLSQELSKRETIGCIIMFAAIILAQLPAPKRNKV